MAVSLSDSPPSQGPSCPVCFRDYSDNETNLIPRILQCGHTYCSECLERLLNTETDEEEYQQVVLNIRYAGREWTTTRNYPRSAYTTNELKCPTCKTVNRIQNRDIASLTKNFALLGCRPQQSVATPNKNKHFCKDHNHEKRIYCNDCKTLICAYCQLYGGHRGHDYMVASEASKPSIESLKAAEDGLTEDLANLAAGENAVNRTISKLAKTRHKCEKNVQMYFEEAIVKLQGQRDSLLAQIASWTDEQLFILKAQLDMLTSAMKELKTVQSSCQALAAGDPLDALTEQRAVEEEVVKIREQVRDVSLQPLINPWIRAKEEGPCDETLNTLVENFKLTYDTDAVGEAPDDQSGNDSDSSEDSLMGASVGLSNVLEAYRLRAVPNIGEDEEGRAATSKQVYSQETQSSLASNFSPMEGAMSLQDPDHQQPSGHDLNWLSNPPSTSFSLFGGHQRRLHGSGGAGVSSGGLNELLDDSASNSDNTDHQTSPTMDMPGFLRYLPPVRRRLIRDGDHEARRMDLSSTDEESDRELEEILDRHQQQSHDSGASGGAASSVGMATGVESVLDSLEIRRHWNFLNREGGGGPRDARRESSSKDEEEEDEEGFSHRMSYHGEGRSAHSDSSSPAPPLRHSSSLTSQSDFAFPHRLSLPVDSGRDPDDEVVFPSAPHYAWTDQLNGRGRALQLNIGASGMLQLSIQPNRGGGDQEDGASHSDGEDGGMQDNS